MQLHELKPKTKRKDSKRVGRGGKRGAYSGKGMKGQQARSGASQRPDFRGGDTPLWKLFPKQRGAKKKVGIKHRMFQLRRVKPLAVNLDNLSKKFSEGETVSLKTLAEKGFINNVKTKVKILGEGKLDKKLNFEGLTFSITALKKLEDSGSTSTNAK